MSLSELWHYIPGGVTVVFTIGGFLLGMLVLSLGKVFVRRHECLAHRQQVGKELVKTVAFVSTDMKVLQQTVNGQDKLFERLEVQVRDLDHYVRELCQKSGLLREVSR